MAIKKSFKTARSTKKTEPKKPLIESESKAAHNWFPGHMLKAMREIKSRLAMVDMVIEIRDARAPLVSGNASLTKAIGGKGRLILLNKANLAEPEAMEKWKVWFEKQEIPFMFINCLEKTALKQVLTISRRIIEQKRRACNEDVTQKTKYKFMIIGLPNTGKSTFINQLANRNASKVADKPGQTRIQLWVNVDEDLQLLDTPGVMPPEVENKEHVLWLSAINAIPDEIVGVEDTACFLVGHLLKRKSQEFLERFKLTSFDVSLDEVFNKIASVRGCLKGGGVPDLDRVYKIVLADFRSGDLGKTCFGLPPQ